MMLLAASDPISILMAVVFAALVVFAIRQLAREWEYYIGVTALVTVAGVFVYFIVRAFQF